VTLWITRELLDSLFKCDTQVLGECLDWRLEAEALSRR
jgi:hypothetical protein